MDRPELYAIIDGLSRTHPPGGLRPTPIELVEWLELVAANPKASRVARADAKRAAKNIHRLITSKYYEMPNYSDTPPESIPDLAEPAPPPAPVVAPSEPKDSPRVRGGVKSPITALAPWYGAKRLLAPRIVHQLGPHHAYHEPFCGGMSVLFAKPACRHEVVNDLNRDLVNVAAVLKCRPLAAELLARLHFTLCAEELYRECRAVVLHPFRGRLGDIDRAYHALVTWWLGRNGMAGTRKSRTSFAARFSAKGGSGGVRFRNLVSSIPAFVNRLAGVDVLNRDGLEMLAKIHDEPGSAIYCDPPYLVKSAEYEHDFAAADHARLAEALGRFEKTRVVVSYYPHPKLEELYPREKWRRVEHVVSKSIRNTNTRPGTATKATELLLVNGDIIPEPEKEKTRGTA